MRRELPLVVLLAVPSACTPDPAKTDDEVGDTTTTTTTSDDATSPWVRSGYVSHAQASFPAVFATIERLLGPPLGRPDAGAAPMFDMFTSVPNLAPYDVIPAGSALCSGP